MLPAAVSVRILVARGRACDAAGRPCAARAPFHGFAPLVVLTAALAGAGAACGGDSGAPGGGARDAGDGAGGDGGQRGDTDAANGALDAGATGERDGGASDGDGGIAARPYPAPDTGPRNRGPGGPATTFTAEQLYVNCAYLDGGEGDTTDHHNLVVMFDGYLLMPWAPEFGGLVAEPGGGLSFFDFHAPCAPARVGYGHSPHMRESHSVGVTQIGDRWYAVVNGQTALGVGGIQFWDVTDTHVPTAVADLALPGFFYPDAYARVTLSVFWQAPYVYVAGADNGVYVVDASNPREPRLVTQYEFQPTLRAGQIIALGNVLVVTAAEGARAVLLDIGDPTRPQPLPGGDFQAHGEEGIPREAYFSNVSGGFLYFARKQGGGGVMIYDIRDPTTPTYAGSYRSNGNGGYVSVHEGFAFVGESSSAAIYDVRDAAAITEVRRVNLKGDLDTLSPIGNVMVLSVDDGADPDRGSAVAPWAQGPDRNPPRPGWAWPSDGAREVPATTRFGVAFNEGIDVKSAWEGSVRLYVDGTDPAVTRVDGWVSVQEAIVTFFPKRRLQAGTTYVLELPAGGVRDYSGNALAETYTVRVRVVGP